MATYSKGSVYSSNALQLSNLVLGATSQTVATQFSAAPVVSTLNGFVATNGIDLIFSPTSVYNTNNSYGVNTNGQIFWGPGSLGSSTTGPIKADGLSVHDAGSYRYILFNNYVLLPSYYFILRNNTFSVGNLSCSLTITQISQA